MICPYTKLQVPIESKLTVVTCNSMGKSQNHAELNKQAKKKKKNAGFKYFIKFSKMQNNS